MLVVFSDHATVVHTIDTSVARADQFYNVGAVERGALDFLHYLDFSLEIS